MRETPLPWRPHRSWLGGVGSQMDHDGEFMDLSVLSFACLWAGGRRNILAQPHRWELFWMAKVEKACDLTASHNGTS